MRDYHRPGMPGHGKRAPVASLPLFAWAAASAAPAKTPTIARAVRRIAAKGRISLHHAAVIATLAGIPTEVHHD